RRCTTVVIARLERHVQGRAVRPRSGLRQRNGLRMLDARMFVPALAHGLVAVDEHSADQRVIFDLPAPPLRELERALEPIHASVCTSWRNARCGSSREKMELPATMSVAPAS